MAIRDEINSVYTVRPEHTTVQVTLGFNWLINGAFTVLFTLLALSRVVSSECSVWTQILGVQTCLNVRQPEIQMLC